MLADEANQPHHVIGYHQFGVGRSNRELPLRITITISPGTDILRSDPGSR